MEVIINSDIKKSKLSVHLLSFVLWLSFFLVIFSTNYIEKGAGISILSLANIRYILYPLLFIGLFVQIILGQKIDKSIFKAFLVTFLFIIIIQLLSSNINYSVIFRIILLIPLVFVNLIEYKHPILEKVLLTIGIFLSLLYSYSQGFIGPDYRFVANSDDPNISSLIFLFGFYFSYRRQYSFFKYIFIFLGILTLSRNFLGAIFIFYLIKYLKEKKVFAILLQKIPIWLAIFLFNFLVISIGSFFTIKDKDNFVYSTNSSSRILHWQDTSNKRRMLYNLLAVFYIFQDKKSFVNGYGEQYVLRKDIFMPKYVHNTFLDLAMSYGLVITVLLILLISKIFQRVVNKTNYEYFYSYLFFTLFLPGCFSGFILYAYYSILCLQESNKAIEK